MRAIDEPLATDGRVAALYRSHRVNIINDGAVTPDRLTVIDDSLVWSKDAPVTTPTRRLSPHITDGISVLDNGLVIIVLLASGRGVVMP